MLVLRDYQSDMLDRARARMRAGVRRLCLVAPTGSGKTVLVARMAQGAVERGKRVQFWVHRREILDQAVRTFVEAAELHTGIISAGYPSDSAAAVQVCSVQTLAKRHARVPVPDIIVVDEAHHQASPTYAALAAAYPKAFFIGVTATPTRGDSKGLRPFFDEMIVGPSTADLIAAEFLAPYRLFAPSTVDMSHVHRVAGDYNKAETSAVMAKTQVVGDAVSTYAKHAAHTHALVFAWSIESSKALAEAFNARGIPAAHLDGDTPKLDRDRLMREFRSGTLKAICSCQLFTEGLDVVGVDSVFLLRPTQSLGLYLQMVGRGLRPAPGKTCLLFDHVGNFERHGLPDDPRAWTLDGISKAASERLSPMKRCAECFLISGVLAKVCPHCGAVYPVKPRKVVQVAGELAETELSALRARLPELGRECRTLSDWQTLAKRLNYKSGWAWFRWSHAAKHRRYSENPDFAQEARDALAKG